MIREDTTKLIRIAEEKVGIFLLCTKLTVKI